VKPVSPWSIERSAAKSVFEEYPFYCHRGGLSEDGWRTMLESSGRLRFSRGGGFAARHIEDAASLGAEMIGYARSEIVRSTPEG